MALRHIKAFGTKRQASVPPSVTVESTGRFADQLLINGLSLLVSSRQSSKVCLLTADDSGVHLMDWNLLGPMGIDFRDSMLCLGWSEGIKTFHNIGTTEHGWAIFVETGDYRTGAVSIHDVGVGDNGKVWFLNTLFSALCILKPGISFAIGWTPPFAGPIGPHDYCHLNGMSFLDGRAQYFTALAASSTAQGWRDNVLDSGVLLSADGTVLAQGLSLPHSPQLTADGVVVLEAGNGYVTRLDPTTGVRQVMTRLSGVLRGADTHGTNLFVGSSKIRSSSGLVANAISGRIQEVSGCRITMLDMATTEIAGSVELPMLEEISTVAVIPAPGLLLEKMPSSGEAFTYVAQL